MSNLEGLKSGKLENQNVEKDFDLESYDQARKNIFESIKEKELAYQSNDDNEIDLVYQSNDDNKIDLAYQSNDDESKIDIV